MVPVTARADKKGDAGRGRGGGGSCQRGGQEETKEGGGTGEGA